MTGNPGLEVAVRDFAHLACRDPAATYDILCAITQALTSPSAEPYAPAAARLAVGIMRAREDYARHADEIAEVLAEEAREPCLPLAGVA